MKFKSISKNNVGILIILLLTVVLSQARFFNFMVNNALGRTLLIAILLILSYIHKILGVICVFLIIIMFNNSDIPYLEGFGFTPSVTTVRNNVTAPLAATPALQDMLQKLPPSTTTTPVSTTTTPASTTTTPASTTTTPASTTTTPASTTTTPASTSTTPASTTTTPASTSSSVAAAASPTPSAAQLAAAQAAQQSISNLSHEFFSNMKGQEGFDIIGKERNIQKGRNSNSIPVNDFMRESTNVAPYEGSLFSESFSKY